MSCVVVGNKSSLQCSFGLAPSPLVVLPNRTVVAESMLMGNISDIIPLGNIQPFGQCTSMSNPMVAAATAAALGVLTPQPCVPVTTSPWVSSAVNVLVNGMPALSQTGMTTCTWGGVIRVNSPGNVTVTVP